MMFEGVPNYPTNSRFWEVIDKHKVNTFYTAPTAIRALMQAGDAPVKKTSRASLRLLGTVGEPINPEAWEWYYHVIGDGRCPIVDTWWQTETGGMLITPLLGAAEVESALVAHPKVSEAAVVGYPHNIKGQGIYAYVTLMAGEQPSEALRSELVAWVRKEIGPIASPDLIQFAPGLPKTRSGKIMRRILRKIAEDESGNLVDISTLADPAVVDALLTNPQN